MSQQQLAPIVEGFRRLYTGWASGGAGIAQMRSDWDAFIAPTKLAAEVADVEANGVACRWVAAPGTRDDAAIVFFHGGGYQIGSLDSHHNLMAALSAAAGCRVLGVDYRLAPENRFPAPVDDALSAYRWLAKRMATERITLCGDSAGGGLAVALMTLLRDKHMPLPAAAVAMSPWVDMEAGGASFESNAAHDPVTNRRTIQLMARAYLGRNGNPREPLASPVHANLARLPPLLVQVGSHEVLLDDARALVATASAQGVDVRLTEWKGMPHVFQLFAGRLDEADAAIHEAGQFLAVAMSQEMRKQA